jgi:hypothetical protein
MSYTSKPKEEQFDSLSKDFRARNCSLCGEKLVDIARMIVNSNGTAIVAGGRSKNCPDPECSMHINLPSCWREI